MIVTICMAYYRNSTMLREQCRRFRALPDDLKANLRLIVVDDGSALPQDGETELSPFAIAAEHEDIGFPFLLFRINVNKRWNQDAARNIAVHNAYSDWILLTDMDHIPTEATLRELTTVKFDPAKVYQFSRRTLEIKTLEVGEDVTTPYKHHPNTWFMTRANYWRIGGYDESLVGYYGTDADFKNRVAAIIGEPVMTPMVVIRVPRDVFPDASTSTYGRKEPMDGELGKLLRTRNATPGWQPKHFTFPFERVA